jgi:DNA ligase-1
MPTDFRSIAELCEALESTNKRKVMIEKVAFFLNRIDLEEIEPAVLMILGRILPRWDQRVMEVSWVTLIRAIQTIADAKTDAFSRAVSKTGDPGDAVQLLFEKHRIRKQTVLFTGNLTILKTYQLFKSIIQRSGEGSREKKDRVLYTLLSMASPLEAKYITRILLRDMRIGFQEGSMELAVAEAFDLPIDLVRTATMFSGDVAEIAGLARAKGKQGLDKVKLTLFRPVKPMLAQVIPSIKDALSEHDGNTAFEQKLDGARIQIHKSGTLVKIFSRRLIDVTDSLPEIVQLAQEEIKEERILLEGEVIAIGKNGNPLPFQHLMRRFGRVHEVEETRFNVPIKLCLFDILLVDDEVLIGEPMETRRKRLEAIVGTRQLVKRIVTKNSKIADRFLRETLEEGHEGLMAKRLDASYTPGKRGKRWLKIKPTLEPLDLVIVAAEYGYGRRHGWLSDYYLAARETTTDRLLTVGKTFKGLTDAEIQEMTDRLKQLTIKKERNRIIVQPRIIVEAIYNEIQESSRYKSGMALRFARISRIRQDKDLEDVDTIEKVRAIYHKQFSRKAKFSRGKV